MLGKMRIIRFALVMFSVLSTGFSAFPQKKELIQATISEIQSNPLKYNGKVVRINGYVVSSHSGVGLTSADYHHGIRLRSPDEVASALPVKRDRLFKKFWRMVESEIVPNTVSVELDGLIRSSKGQPVDYLGKWPVVDVVPVRIIRITGKVK